jgi:pimeloyl-ACP methyl ester carboxylesterase
VRPLGSLDRPRARAPFAGPGLLRWPAAGTPSLLFLPGSACGAWIWEQGFAAALAEAGCPGLALDFARAVSEQQLAGLGDYVAQARAVLRRIEGPVVLVAHSLGALVAQHLLLEPAVRGAALLAPVPPEGLWLANARLPPAAPAPWREAAPPGAATAPELFGAAMPAALGRCYLARMGHESRRALQEAQGPQSVPHGWLHRRPVLVLGAAQDRMIPAGAVRRCALWHGRAAEFLPDAGHMLMLEPCWPRIVARLLGWLRQAGLGG